MSPLMHQLMKVAPVGGGMRADCPPTPSRCQRPVPVVTLLTLCIHILVCLVMLCVLSSLHHSVAHWDCIVFPGGERNCGVHELVCVRKGRAGQNSGRLTSDLWRLTWHLHPHADRCSLPLVCTVSTLCYLSVSGPVSSMCSHLSLLFISELTMCVFTSGSAAVLQ